MKEDSDEEIKSLTRELEYYSSLVHNHKTATDFRRNNQRTRAGIEQSSHPPQNFHKLSVQPAKYNAVAAETMMVNSSIPDARKTTNAVLVNQTCAQKVPRNFRSVKRNQVLQKCNLVSSVPASEKFENLKVHVAVPSNKERSQCNSMQSTIGKNSIDEPMLNKTANSKVVASDISALLSVDLVKLYKKNVLSLPESPVDGRNVQTVASMASNNSKPNSSEKTSMKCGLVKNVACSEAGSTGVVAKSKYKIVKTNTQQESRSNEVKNIERTVTGHQSALIQNKFKLVRRVVEPSESPVGVIKLKKVEKEQLHLNQKLNSVMKGNYSDCGLVGNAARSKNNQIVEKTKYKIRKTNPQEGSGIACIGNRKTNSDPQTALIQTKFKLVRKKRLSNEQPISNSPKLLKSPVYLRLKVTSAESPAFFQTIKQNRKFSFKRNAKFEGFSPVNAAFKSRWPVQTRKKTRARFNSKYSLQRQSGDSTQFNLSINAILGRTVQNLSCNKYKFINASHPVSSERSTNPLRVNHRTIDRRIRRKSQQSWFASVQNSKFSYRNSVICRLRSISGSRIPNFADSFKFPKRIGYNRRSSNESGRVGNPDPYFNAKQFAASRIVCKSFQRTLSSKQASAKQYCMFFNRFGRCHRGAKCKDIHDPDKISVCTRFLRGTCKVVDCPFSHLVAKEKMPTCSFFLRGICKQGDSCPYSHVNVGSQAEVCQEFIRGYCPLGEKCRKKHIIVCPKYSRCGSCPRADRCQMRHVMKTARKRENSISHESSSCKKKRESSVLRSRSRQPTNETDDDAITWAQKTLPSFISLKSSSDSETKTPDTPTGCSSTNSTLLIRPRILPVDKSKYDIMSSLIDQC